MADYVIGPGVQAAIDEAGDAARSDEIFVILEPGHKVSQTFSVQGIYWWYEEDNAVRRVSF